MRKTPYRCAHCLKTVWRDGKLAWVKSFCTTTGRQVHLVRQGKRR